VLSTDTEHILICPKSLLVGHLSSLFFFYLGPDVADGVLRNNGFLRYWTVSNVPLFLLASPMIFVLAKSGWDVMWTPKVYLVDGQWSKSGGVHTVIQAAAFAQLLIAVLTFFNHHVQVITRLSSGYPIWYMWLACNVVRGDGKTGANLALFMVMYASVQAVLFASFLPPA
jgi:GPI mannosyltransferase 2